MEIFEVIAGVSSIVSLLISIFVASKVVTISQQINSNNKNKQKIKGDKNTMSGGDTTIHR